MVAVADVAGAGIAGGFLSAAGKREFAVRGANDLPGDAEKGGLAGAVATGKDGAFAGRNFKSDAAEREESSIAFINVLEAEAGW